MSEEETFLRAICASPDDDTPRLVFADWLDEQGGVRNEEWAELIRVQVQLARGAGAERERLTAREQELETNVIYGWPARLGFPHPLAESLSWGNWSRGFPLAVSGFGGDIRKAYHLFAGRVPIREFNIQTACDEDLIVMSAWPELELVRKLGVWTGPAPISEAGFVAMCESEYLCDLQRLRMQWVAYTGRGVRAFLDSPHMRNLISVKVVGHGFNALPEELRQRVQGRFGRWDVY